MQNNPRKLSLVLKDAINGLKEDSIKLQQLTDHLGTRAYGIFIVLMSLPNFIPGLAAISSIILIIFSLQMFAGIEKPWLPKFIRELSLKRSTLKEGIEKLLPYIERLEHYIQPRFIFISSVTAIRCTGIVIAYLNFIILLPFPFSNLIPAIAVLAIAFGLLQKDGLIVIFSTVIGITYSTVFLWLVWSLIIRIITII